MAFRVAVVAMACEFPDSRTPDELWGTVLHGRRCFRAIPSERLSLADYAAQADPDGIDAIEAGLLEGYQFDRERFRIPLSTFERTDMAHWLALDVASRALSALGPDGIDDERDDMAVIVANTLTGEFSRAHALRYRWPYVERAIRQAARGKLPEPEMAALLSATEDAYKAPLPVPDEDSLAGALANTIAGRIANYHGLRGGAHAVDGACASSLVAVTSAYEKLAMGDAACALVGAVDLSLDPFELVGFSRNGALAHGPMRVFDRQSSGFWPGEGCGFIVLATEQAAARNGWPVLAWLRGAAMSTDGQGAITRPTPEGQTLAARRAWRRAGLQPVQADYFEAHGTGTPTGDAVELAGLAALLGTGTAAQPIPIGSIKANFGHAKAAAGMAGLLKAIAICRERIIPPTTGCVEPHPLLQQEVAQQLGVRLAAQAIAHERPVIAGVNSFGFGGVNCHVVVEGASSEPAMLASRVALPRPPGLNDGELFQLAAADAEQLAEALAQLAGRAASLSHAQMADLACAMSPEETPAWRACVIAATPQELQANASAAAEALRASGQPQRLIGQRYSFSRPAPALPRIAMLFPGQGSAVHLQPARWAARFPFLRPCAERAEMWTGQNAEDTAVLQPLLAELAIAGIDLLRHLEIFPDTVLGHSFGELSALHASGQCDADDLRRLARQRGACMRDLAQRGAMLAVHAPREVAQALAASHRLELACENGAQRFVLAGAQQQVTSAAAACAADRIAASILPTAFAFHSSGMRAACEAFAPHASGITWRRSTCDMISSITGDWLDGTEPLADLLTRQITDSVKFAPALARLGELDLVLEVGAGAVLSGMAEERYPGRVVAMELFSGGLQGTLAALGAAWVCGAPLRRAVLYEGRGLRPCALDVRPLFLRNPCGVTQTPSQEADSGARHASRVSAAAQAVDPLPLQTSALDALLTIVAEQTGLPAASLETRLRLLADLHLNSIRARHVVALAAQRLGIGKLPFELTRLANASLEEAAGYLEGLRQQRDETDDALPAGLAPWLRFYTHEWQVATAPPEQRSLQLGQPLVQQIIAAANESAPSWRDAEGDMPAILVLPEGWNHGAAAALLQAVQQIPSSTEGAGLLVLQAGQMANGLLRSAAAELPACRLCAVEYRTLDQGVLQAALNEYASLRRGYSELRWDEGQAWRRMMTRHNLPSGAAPWAPPADSVLLVTGGARGIGAASARTLARRYGYRLALLGRSPADHDEVRQHLQTCREQGLEVRYFNVDLADAPGVRNTIAAIRSQMGEVRALLHAAGVNHPQGVHGLDTAELLRTLAGKVSGLEHLLDCLPSPPLQLLIGYGSIIGELGLAGEAHYALANEWLGAVLQRFRHGAPACRVLQLNWTAWRELGMARRLDGVLEQLQRAGTRPLDNEEALAALEQVIDAAPELPLIVTGRYGRPLAAAELRRLQAHRYLEHPRVFYPGVELVADAVISSDSDRYLQDHAPYGIPVFPLVCAMEAMLSAVHCLLPDAGPLQMHGMRVGEGIAGSLGQRFVLRTSALMEIDGSVAVELRCGTTGFEVVHFAAVFRQGQAAPAIPLANQDTLDTWPAAPLLYQGLCFHGPRFQHVVDVTQLRASACQVRVAGATAKDWYGPLLPRQTQYGAPAMRDAVLHALQLCVPHQVVLPVSVGTVHLGHLAAQQDYLVSARQCFSDGWRFVFDVAVHATDGELVEYWHGLELVRSSADAAATTPLALAPALLAPLAERLCGDQLGRPDARAGIAAGERASARQLALARAGIEAAAVYTSISHAQDLSIAITSPARRLAIDLQFNPGYGEEAWRLMLGDERMRFVEELIGQDAVAPDMAMLFTWTISECLIKLGLGAWPMGGASRRGFDTAHLGTSLTFRCGPLHGVVSGLVIAGYQQSAALAVILQEES